MRARGTRQSGWQRLKLNLALRRVALSIDARGEPMRLRAGLWRHGHNVRLSALGIDCGAGLRIADLGLVQMGLRIDPENERITCGEAAALVGRGPADWLELESRPTARFDSVAFMGKEASASSWGGAPGPRPLRASRRRSRRRHLARDAKARRRRLPGTADWSTGIELRRGGRRGAADQSRPAARGARLALRRGPSAL
jgi:hypothetical protein